MGNQLDHLSLYDWIEQYVTGGHSSNMGQLLDVAYNIEYGRETKVQSSLNLVYLLPLAWATQASPPLSAPLPPLRVCHSPPPQLTYPCKGMARAQYREHLY